MKHANRLEQRRQFEFYIQQYKYKKGSRVLGFSFYFCVSYQLMFRKIERNWADILIDDFRIRIHFYSSCLLNVKNIIQSPRTRNEQKEATSNSKMKNEKEMEQVDGNVIGVRIKVRKGKNKINAIGSNE